MAERQAARRTLVLASGNPGCLIQLRAGSGLIDLVGSHELLHAEHCKLASHGVN